MRLPVWLSGRFRAPLALAGPVILLAVFAAGRQPGPAFGPVDAAAAAEIDRLFAGYQGNRPGYAVGVFQRGRLVYGRGFGMADLDHRIPIGPSSVFNVASLSKQFTAACIGILIRRGQVSLDDEVRRHLPEFPEYPGPIRVKHLVYMTSGLPEYYTLPRPGGRTWDLDYFTTDDAIAAVLQQRQLQFAPGARWAYSNTNYMLLSAIVARVSGIAFSQFADREIFAPLGMTRSHVDDDLGRVVPERATGYNARASGGYQREIRRSPHFGGSGVFSTVEDLARWSRSFETHQLGGPELTSLLLSTMRFEHDKVNDAFGLVWGQHRGHRTLWYEGGDQGFSSYMVRFPDHESGVIVLSNLGTGRAADHATRVVDALLTP
jgi:CubicO group peptidase (beta-lactamase class C family)